MEMLIRKTLGGLNIGVSFICDLFCSDLTAYSLRKPLQKWNKK